MRSELDFFLLHHRVFLVKHFYQLHGDYLSVKTKYETKYQNCNESPNFSSDILVEIINLFEQTGSVFKNQDEIEETDGCQQIEQIYVKPEKVDEDFEDSIQEDSEICSEPQIFSNNHEENLLIEEFKIETVHEESQEMPQWCSTFDNSFNLDLKPNLKRKHMEDPNELLSDGSSTSKGLKLAKASKEMEKNRLKGEKRSTTDEKVMQAALHEILQGRLRIKDAAAIFRIPLTTLYSRLQRIKEDLSESKDVALMMGLKIKERVNKFASKQILTMPQEKNLVSYLLTSSKINFGLSLLTTREMAYQYAVSIGQKVPVSWETNKRAGAGWARLFLRRHSEISLRKLEATSLARNSSISQENVEIFSKNLQDMMEKHCFEPSRIFCLDETGLSTVLQSPKVEDGKKSKKIGKCGIVEGGERITICAFVNAAGESYPPIYLFPRKTNHPEYMEGGFEGSIAFFNEKGYMNTETFLKTLKYFKSQIAASKDDQILLILDNHMYHLSLDAIKFCTENGIHMLTLPPHTSHRTQPLDLSVFAPFKTYCATAFDNWISEEVGNKVNIRNIARLSLEPLQKCMTPENIKDGFMRSGIYPMDNSKLVCSLSQLKPYSTLLDDIFSLEDTTQN